MDTNMDIFCCGCGKDVSARLTTGGEIYPHRMDLSDKKFWKCDVCRNYIGIHAKSGLPLGVIPTPELRKSRIILHRAIDPIWKSGNYTRSGIYKELSTRLGIKEFHTGEIKTLAEFKLALLKIEEIKNEL